VKKRIAKKVMKNKDHVRYKHGTKYHAARRLGVPMILDKDMDRPPPETQNEAIKPKTVFNYRTGHAPSTPGVIPPTTVNSLDELTQDSQKMGLYFDLEDKTLVELKDLAKSMGKKNYSTLKKAELMALIRG